MLGLLTSVLAKPMQLYTKGKGKGVYAATHRFFACESYGTTIAQVNSWRKVKTDEQGGTTQHSKQF